MAVLAQGEDMLVAVLIQGEDLLVAVLAQGEDICFMGAARNLLFVR